MAANGIFQVVWKKAQVEKLDNNKTELGDDRQLPIQPLINLIVLQIGTFSIPVGLVQITDQTSAEASATVIIFQTLIIFT